MRADPAMEIKRANAFRARLAADPDMRRALAEASQARLKAWRSDPDNLAALIARSKGNLDRSRSPENTRKAIKAAVETRLSWCPAEYRDRYKALKKDGRVPAKVAREMILDEIRADARRAVRQIERAQRERRAKERQDAY